MIVLRKLFVKTSISEFPKTWLGAHLMNLGKIIKNQTWICPDLQEQPGFSKNKMVSGK
jgi:hypothetical protein